MVTRAATLFADSDCVGRFDPQKGISDHSLLTWVFNLQSPPPIMHTTLSSISFPDVKKYDVHTIPTEFMMNTDVVAQARNMHGGSIGTNTATSIGS